MAESFLVTGGEGFLGHRMITMLRERNPDSKITSVDLVQRHETSTHSFLPGDLTDASAILKVFRESGATTVFHVAAGLLSSPKPILEKVNIGGTRNIIDACLACRVKKLVYTSSSGVVFDGNQLINVDERLPAVEQTSFDDYMWSKAVAEKMVLEANGKQGLLTCAIRPAGIFGPGDHFLAPQMVSILKEGRTAWQLGDNQNLFDFTYVDNVVHGHLLAAAKLGIPINPEILLDRLPDSPALTFQIRPVPTSYSRIDDDWDANEKPLRSAEEADVDCQLTFPRNRFDQFYPATKEILTTGSLSPSSPAGESLCVAGQAFYITNNEPLYFWDMLRALWMAYSSHEPMRIIAFPEPVALVLGSVMAVVNRWLGRPETFTRSKVVLACANKYHNIEKARRLLGYEPLVGMEEGIRRFMVWYKMYENDPNRRQKGVQEKKGQ